MGGEVVGVEESKLRRWMVLVEVGVEEGTQAKSGGVRLWVEGGRWEREW